MELGIWIVVAFVALVLLWFILYFIPIGLWFSALVSGVRISLIQLVLMRFRKVPPSVIVNQLIAGTKAGLRLNTVGKTCVKLKQQPRRRKSLSYAEKSGVWWHRRASVTGRSR